MSTAQAFERLLPWIRSQFPQIETLRDGTNRVYLDNAAGTLVPQSVADAMANAAIWANPQPGRDWPGGTETGREHARVRAQVRDFLNAAPGDTVLFSESTTASLYKLRESLEPAWSADSNVVVTDADHFANITPWEWRARWEVRRVGMFPDGTLDVDGLSQRVDDRTTLVAITMASNGLGTVIDLEGAVQRIRERNPRALIVIDAVHGAPHLPIDVQALGVDALAFSTYKLFGPLAGILWISEALRAKLTPYHVEPHSELETWMEWGTLNNVTVAGAGAALDYLRRLGERLEPQFVGQLTGYSRERRIYKIALTAIREYEAELSRRLLKDLKEVHRVRLYGITDPEQVEKRVPTIAFLIDGVAEADLERRLWDANRLQVAAGSHYAASVLRGLGRASMGRASFAHYNAPHEVEAFLVGVMAVARS